MCIQDSYMFYEKGIDEEYIILLLFFYKIEREDKSIL